MHINQAIYFRMSTWMLAIAKDRPNGLSTSQHSPQKQFLGFHSRPTIDGTFSSIGFDPPWVHSHWVLFHRRESHGSVQTQAHTTHYLAAASSATWSTTQAKAISYSDVTSRPHTHRERAPIRGYLVRVGQLQNEIEKGSYSKLVQRKRKEFGFHLVAWTISPKLDEFVWRTLS